MPVILAIQEAEIQEDHSLKSTQANGSPDPILKNKNRAGGVAQDEGPDFKPQYRRKKKKERKKK
jgi:hypothetical protein